MKKNIFRILAVAIVVSAIFGLSSFKKNEAVNPRKANVTYTKKFLTGYLSVTPQYPECLSKVQIVSSPNHPTSDWIYFIEADYNGETFNWTIILRAGQYVTNGYYDDGCLAFINAHITYDGPYVGN